jgi:hypothetical protein
MKRLMLVACAGIALLSGCASNGSQDLADAGQGINRDEPPLGSLIKRKQGTAPAQNAQQADLQQLENARMTGNGNMSGR